MRIPLPTNLTSRNGTVTKDAKISNGFVDGDLVFKRPAVNTASVDVTGAAQGGIYANSLIFVLNGDVLKSYNTSYVLQATYTL